jgi:hypothetical protein
VRRINCSLYVILATDSYTTQNLQEVNAWWYLSVIIAKLIPRPSDIYSSPGSNLRIVENLYCRKLLRFEQQASVPSCLVTTISILLLP